jgi:hypothetical protein
VKKYWLHCALPCKEKDFSNLLNLPIFIDVDEPDFVESTFQNILACENGLSLAAKLEQKAEILMPYLQTRLMINEAISLNTKITEMGYVKLLEAVRTDTKDRYMTLMMANLLADKIQLKYQKNNEPDWTDEDWAWLAG